MSFYHVLPSNTSPKTFPQNNASLYSTPLENPYRFEGSYEVALVNATYSNCINTFNHDKITIREKIVDLTRVEVGTRIPVPQQVSKVSDETLRANAIDHYVREINSAFRNILHLKTWKSHEWIEWKVITDKVIVLLSKKMTEVFDVGDVLVSYDTYKFNRQALKQSHIVFQPGEVVTGIIPQSKYIAKIVIKKFAEGLYIQELVDRLKNAKYKGKHLMRVEFKDGISFKWEKIHPSPNLLI